MSDEPMRVTEVVKGLTRVVELQSRSAIQHTSISASMTGLANQLVADRLWEFAQLELADLRKFVAKLVALGGEPSGNVESYDELRDPVQALRALVQNEQEVLGALHDIIADTGQEPRSEALEHLLEHALQRKQEQVDWLRVVLGES